MVYIPYLMFAQFKRNKNPGIMDIEIYCLWTQLLSYHASDKEDWGILEREYGALLRYNWSNWTPGGRVPRPVRRPR